MGISHGKKVVFYAGGAVTLFPTEPQYAKHLKQAIESGILEHDTVVLVRSHPLDTIERWDNYIGKSKYVVYDEGQHGMEKLDYVNVTDDDISRLISSLYHSDVHVNLCSTMTVDGSVFLKPQIAPYYDDANKAGESALRAMYLQEHFIPILRSNVVQLAHTKEEILTFVKNALTTPSKYNTNCTRCMHEIITFNDGKSANRVVETLKSFFLR